METFSVKLSTTYRHFVVGRLGSITTLLRMSTSLKVIQNGRHNKCSEINRDELKKFATICLGNNNNYYSLKKQESDLLFPSFLNCSKSIFTASLVH